MGLPKKLLGDAEQELLHLHTHAKALFLPVAVLLLTSTALGFVIALTPAEWRPTATYIETAVALLVFAAWVLLPFLRWLTTTYTFTDRRIITRSGILTKRGHDLPLSRINNVAYERDLLDRILGCGTLVLTTAAEAPVVLSDIPNVEDAHVMMTELLFGSDNPDDSVLDI
ncbi:MAG: PH domain-containing protein [Propionibacteriaceae bacterium]|jgi:uncharacterized membrane protein YdbT with pleckstrin-like domain|nr:PH domain-containing protein [Propionibacteriaceae bacterium]